MANVRNYAAIPTERMDFYADGTSGDDSNTGLVGSPVQTISKLGEIMEGYMDYVTTPIPRVVHLSGIFDDIGNVSLNHAYYIDGGSDVVVITSGTVDAGATNLVIPAQGSPGWTEDEHMGYAVRMTSGASSGQHRMVHANDSDSFTLCRRFVTNPSSGDTFEIVRPATEIRSTAAQSYFYMGGFVFQMQRIYLSGPDTRIRVAGGDSSHYLNYIISDSPETITGGTFQIEEKTACGFRSITFDPTTLANISQDEIMVGVGQRNASSLVRVNGCSYFYMDSSVCRNVLLNNTKINRYYYGCRTKGYTKLLNCTRYNNSGGLGSGSGLSFSLNKFENPSGVGLYMENSNIKIDDTCDFSDSSSHGIEAKNSQVDFIGAASGTGNTGAGLYGHSGSQVTITDGSPPTLTGTVGDATVDGETEAFEWADVDGGTEFHFAGELKAEEV